MKTKPKRRKVSLPVLPEMQCDKGCGECCGPVLCKQHEYDRVVEYAQQNGIEPKRQGETCPWYQDGGCKVYPVRPFICRLFGHSEDLVCSRGYNVNIPKLLEKRATASYGKPETLLHFVFEDWKEVLSSA